MQRFGGVSNCFVQLIRNLPSGVDFDIAIREGDNMHLKDSGLKDTLPPTLVEENFISTKKFKSRGFLYRRYSKMFPEHTSLGRNRLCSIEALIQGDFDVFHPTFFDDYFLPYLNGKPFVLTVHDMIPEKFWGHKLHDMQISNKPLLCRKAAHIIAVSENTKRDLVEILHVPADKISVIYHGAPEDVVVKDEKPRVEEKYLLYVGQRELYKCFERMLATLASVFERHHELKMVCTGKPFTKREISQIRLLGLEGRMIHLHPDDHDMMNLYAHALCFIYPSLYEGFGIPILEAYRAGCPVLLNHKSCFPEIAQDAAIYFHLSESESDLAEVMEQFMNMTDKELELLKGKQYERLKSFSWAASAKKLADIYQSVI